MLADFVLPLFLRACSLRDSEFLRLSYAAPLVKQ